jgi:Leucine-rich repeat (LRR) protein
MALTKTYKKRRTRRRKQKRTRRQKGGMDREDKKRPRSISPSERAAAETVVTPETMVAAYPQVSIHNLLRDVHQQFPQATSIQLGRGTYSTQIPPTIGQLVDLESIILRGFQVDGNIPLQLCELRKLKVLDLQNTNLRRFEEGFSFANFRALETLTIEQNSLLNFNAKRILEDLSQPGHHPALRSISLLPLDQEDDPDLRIPETIGNLEQLTFLNLAECGFIGPIPESLFALHNLQTLTIEASAFTCALSDSVRNLQQLRKLQIQCSGLTGPIPAGICQLTLLETLDLTDNRFEGSLPEHIGNLHNLTELIVDRCGLTGAIPDSIGHLTNLRVLDLGMNHFTGTLPHTIGNLTNLEDLSIVRNNLTDGGRYLSNLFFHVRRLHIIQFDDLQSQFSAYAIEAIRSNGSFGPYEPLPGQPPITDAEPLPITYFDAVSDAGNASRVLDVTEFSPETLAEITTWIEADELPCFEICRRITFLDIREDDEGIRHA